jgi:hypothetical protein
MLRGNFSRGFSSSSGITIRSTGTNPLRGFVPVSSGVRPAVVFFTKRQIADE